jgi:hypothetical protein
MAEIWTDGAEQIGRRDAQLPAIVLQSRQSANRQLRPSGVGRLNLRNESEANDWT